MGSENLGGFEYQASLPYETETNVSARQELNNIVANLERLYASRQFQHYEFGTGYALEVWKEIRALQSWIKRKLTIPLDVRLGLTTMFAQACFEAVEPVLVVRYGSACCALWKGRIAQQELAEQTDLINWATLIRAVRNLVLLSPSTNHNEINGRSFENHNSLSFAEMVKHGTPSKVILTMARLFRSITRATEAIWDQLHNDILSFLGPSTHDPKDTLVMESFAALIPTRDLDSAPCYISLLYDLRYKVSETLFYQCAMPVLAEYVEIKRKSDSQSDPSPALLSEEQLDLCFQAALHAFDIPLMSTQASKSKTATMRQAVPTLGMSGSGSRLLRSTGNTYNNKAHAVNSAAFAKLVVYGLNSQDKRGLDKLDAVINAVSSFCHPSNSGPWSTLIVITLTALTSEMSQRINAVGDLEQSLIDRFVEILRPVILMGVHSHIPFVVSASLDILRHLALFSHALICPLVLSEVYPTLQHGLHQANRLASSIAILSRLAVPLVTHPQYKMHLTTLLELALPNLDANDSKRCLLTLDLFQAVASVSVFEDVSDSTNVAIASQVLPECVHTLEESGGEMLPLEEDTLNSVVQGTSAAYPEILSFYVRRMFELLETTSEQRLGSVASASILRVLTACSPAIFEKLSDIALEEISNPQQQYHDAFAQVCGSFVRVDCASVFPKMWKLLESNIREEINENQAGSGRVALPKDNNLQRNLSVLNMCLLACNANVIVNFASSLQDVLVLLREKTGASVVYTVANTVHHAIVALTSYGIVLPHPGPFKLTRNNENNGDQGPFKHNQEHKKLTLSQKSLDYLSLTWNVPTDASKELAITLFKINVDFSETKILANIGSASKNIQSEDTVTNALIFIRTTLGAIANLTSNEEVRKYRAKILKLIVTIYSNLSKDDVASLKEVLFVAKVWACDVGYERTSRLDQHLATLYNYEKRPFVVKGARKRCLPPAILARRAQLYHHQRLAVLTQHREADEGSVDLIMNTLVDACFSAYPAVRRNAFSALYSPLKIFNDPNLYSRVYDLILVKLSSLLEKKEYEKVEGGIALLRYRSLGVQTVGRTPAYIRRFFDVCREAASADFRQLSTLATLVYFTMLSDICRLGMFTELHETRSNGAATSHTAKFYVEDLVEYLLTRPLDKLHWRDALFTGSTLLAITQNPQFPVKEDLLKLFIEGSLIDHPDVRSISMFGVLNVIQMIFRQAMLPAQSPSMFRADAELEAPAGYNHDEETFENDWPAFFMQAFSQSSKLAKSQLIITCFVAPMGSQGWAVQPRRGIIRAPAGPPDLSNVFKTKDLNSMLASSRLGDLIKALLAIRLVEPRPEQDRLSHAFTLYYRDLIGLGAASGNFAEILLKVPEVQKPDDASDKNWHRVAAEWVCGQILATPILNDHDRDLLVADTLTTLRLASDYLSPETLGYWLSAISHALSQVDYRRCLPVIEFFETQARADSAQDGGGIKLSMRMALYTEVLATLQWHRPNLLAITDQWSTFNHSLQTTRESAGDEISIAAFGTLRPSAQGDTADGVLKLGTLELQALQTVFDTRDTSTATSKRNLSLLYLLLRILQLLGGDTCLDLLLSHGFPLLLDCSAVRDDPEIVTLVTNVFLELGSCHFTPQSARILSDYLIKSMKSTQSGQWHLRIRLLLFIQPFYFNHLIVLSADTRKNLTLLVVDSLTDPQVEVRDLAADTLSGIVRCSPNKEQAEYVELLNTRFSRNVGSKAELVDRHAAVLGLGALVGAFPYASPPPTWVPQILATLAVKAASDSGVVGKSTKKILSDFKKTRQDTWHIDQAAFTQDQLDDLDGVLWRNYFA